ncbi:hypothetical protein BJ170DRAFT_681537 [Xylariales sp. AK1849]|nr:hypothetical protein BJ170DRAFT_681537 [Xylariales sp. AK1849]
MVLSMLLALTTCPAMLGSQEAIRDSQSKTRKDEHRSQRCNLMVTCLKPSTRSGELNNRTIVLRDSKLFIHTDTGLHGNNDNGPAANPHQFAGYFLPYPDTRYEGLVSTITDEAPILNWIYVDRNSYEVKYGLRVTAQPHLTGPFDCTRQDRRLIFDSWEGFAAVEEEPGVWALYFDYEDDGLSKISSEKRVLEVELTRREKKIRKPAPDAAQTLEELMRQQQTQQESQDTPK